MLNNRKAFEKLMALLSGIKPKVPLPVGFEHYLWNNMEEYIPKANEVLVKQGERPKYAYFIIRGFIYVYYFDDNGKTHVKRFYKERRIVAFLSFLEQTASPYFIVAGRDTLLSRISAEHMCDIYRTWNGMKEFAQLVVLRYDECKEKMRIELLALEPDARIGKFYKRFDCLRPKYKARMSRMIGLYLHLSTRTIQRWRGDEDDDE